MKQILGPKYVKAANMFCVSIFDQIKKRQEVLWFQNAEEARMKILEENDKE
jgi:hypothetical protein